VSKTRAYSKVEAQSPTPKKPFKTPRLTEYGHIAKLTAGTTGSHTDKGTLANRHGEG
jgi:hypothetical protein